MSKGSLFQLKKIILLIILSTVTLSLPALRITSKVCNTSDKPIEDVSVYDGFKRVFTDKNGVFSIETKADRLILSKLGYERLVIAVTDVSALIILQDKPIILASVKVTERFEPGSIALDKTTLTNRVDGISSLAGGILTTQSTVTSSATRLMGENQTLSLLGNLNRHTLIVLDNVSLNPNGEAFDLSTLDFSSIRRIEIVRGNASVYGGNAAIGGIIYLFTDDLNKAAPLSLEQETLYGSYRQFRQNYVYEQKAPDLNFRVAITGQSARNDFAYKPRPWWNIPGNLTRENNQNSQQAVSFKLSSAIKQINWVYNLDAGQLFRQLPGPVNFLTVYNQAFLTGQTLRQNLNLDYQADKLTQALTLWENTDKTAYNNTRSTNPVYQARYNQYHTSSGLKGQTGYDLYPFSGGLGFEYSIRSFERKDLLYPALSIEEITGKQAVASLKGAYTAESQLLKNVLQASLRLDDVTDFGSFASWRLEDLVTTDTQIALQAGAMLGTSFSLPSYYDLYWKGDAQSLGNPDLKPETSMGGSIWASATYAGHSIKAAWYQNDIKKLIQWRQTYLYGTAWKPVNIGKASINNVEFEYRGNWTEFLNAYSSFTLTDARDKTGADAYKLTYTPEMKWVSGIDVSRQRLRLSLNLEHTGRQWTTPDNLIDPLPAVTLINAGLYYHLVYKKTTADFSLKGNNLFDKQYEIYSYVPQPGFNWLCAINLHYDM